MSTKKKSKKSTSPFIVSPLVIVLTMVFLSLVSMLIFQKTFLIKTAFTQQVNPVPKIKEVVKTQPTKPAEKKAEEYVPQIIGHQVRVPILMYHYIGENPDPKDTARNSISLGPTKFEEEMKYLRDNGYNTITLDTLYPALKDLITLPNKSVILTFDDGYMDFYYNAYPILSKYGLHATVFIPTNLMNQGYYLTWAQIKEMSSSGLITFGTHGVHHYHFTSLSTQDLDFELSESKKILQDNLGIPINFVAYPYGSANYSVIEATKKAGYMGALGTWANKIQSEGTLYNMPRLRIGGGLDLQNFINLL
ncbi:MAG: polysaccharide deacetylase family protein [Candidatus Daviesbacteria bacterium]